MACHTITKHSLQNPKILKCDMAYARHIEKNTFLVLYEDAKKI